MLNPKNEVRATELSARKRAVLAAVIKAYIETGEPIGSKILMGLLDNAPSSATLRNEMNELCGLGLLAQPHTSAGRIPTSSGYRLYVNSLMHPLAIGESTRRYIDMRLAEASADVQAIPRLACEVLSELTGFPAVYCYMVSNDVYLKKAELLPVGKRSAILLIVTSDGRTQSRVCRFPSGYSAEIYESFKRISAFLKRKPLSYFTRPQLQNITASSINGNSGVLGIITELFDMASSADSSLAELVGDTSLYNICEENQAQRIVSLCRRTELLLWVLGPEGDKTEVIFGSDTGFPELSSKVLAVSKYNSGNKYCGKIGIIGTDRMSYELILPSIEYTASRLSQLITEAQSDMED